MTRQVVKQFIKYVGPDVHKETIAVAVAVADADGGEVRFFGAIRNTAHAFENLIETKGSATP